MSDSPRPRSFVTRALEQQHIDYLNQLDATLTTNPFDYYSHVQLVTGIHQGFQNHLSMADGEPHAFELVHTLRDVYRAMSEKYPLGETLWHYRLNDEKTLARNVEERMGVLELHKQATQDEPYSAKLWAAYSEYVSYLVACCWEQLPPEQWSEEERLIGRELFSPQLLLETLQQGAENVKYNLQESNLVWDRYLQVLEENLERGGVDRGSLEQEKARVATIYNERLGQPHATWKNTRSRYISFVSRYNLGSPEDIMEQVTSKNSHIIQQQANREEYEFKVLQAIQQGDQDAEYHAVTRYLKWEKKTMGVYSFHLVNALYERATLRFPVDSSIWEDHVEFLIWQKDRSVDLLNVLERATRHCPWSGSLWSHRILTLEAEHKAFEDIERVKHTATGTGLLEHTDIEELIKVQIAWCGYLRRRAFDSPGATEDDADIAEVGIRSALEFVREVGMKKHGREWSDSKYRLERIHIKFFAQRGQFDEARQIMDSLSKRQADSYDFWYRWYITEMIFWSQHVTRNESHAGQHLPPPSRATAVLERGLERLHTIDQPEPLLEMYSNHCEQHESVLQVRSSTIERRRAERVIAIRRAKERANAEAEAAQQQLQQSNATEGSGKRKRDNVSNDDDDAALKKSKLTGVEALPLHTAPVNGDVRMASEAPSDAQSTGPKRDREHTSIIVRKLPADTTQTRIRQFFTDAGIVRNLILKPEQDSITAIVEFETPEEATYALSKQAKGFEGHSISIERGESTTLYVTNYPAHADEAYLQKLFSPFGEIVAFRFPSLKFDTHRRFCYVQYANAESAVAATQLDGTNVEGLKLVAKISNPTAKKQRDGATAEGREVYIWHLNFKIKQREIEETFSRFGKIDRVKCPTIKGNGNNKGFCFVVYDTKESADAAVAEMHNKNFWGLDLHVEIANERGDSKPKIKSTLENADSPNTHETTPAQGEPKAGTVSERSIAFLNLPDTVPDTRIKPLVEPFGFKKITLEPRHGGAIIEFASIEGAGKAEIALQGRDFEGRKLRIGTVQDLKKQKGEWKASNNFIQPARVNRPSANVRGGGRGRGKPGLGRPAIPKGAATTNGEVKSNADFRSMILNKQTKKEDTDKMDE